MLELHDIIAIAFEGDRFRIFSKDLYPYMISNIIHTKADLLVYGFTKVSDTLYINYKNVEYYYHDSNHPVISIISDSYTWYVVNNKVSNIFMADKHYFISKALTDNFKLLDEL